MMLAKYQKKCVGLAAMIILVCTGIGRREKVPRDKSIFTLSPHEFLILREDYNLDDRRLDKL